MFPEMVEEILLLITQRSVTRIDNRPGEEERSIVKGVVKKHLLAAIRGNTEELVSYTVDAVDKLIEDTSKRFMTDVYNIATEIPGMDISHQACLDRRTNPNTPLWRDPRVFLLQCSFSCLLLLYGYLEPYKRYRTPGDFIAKYPELSHEYIMPPKVACNKKEREYVELIRGKRIDTDPFVEFQRVNIMQQLRVLFVKDVVTIESNLIYLTNFIVGDRKTNKTQTEKAAFNARLELYYEREFAVLSRFRQQEEEEKAADEAAARLRKQKLQQQQLAQKSARQLATAAGQVNSSVKPVNPKHYIPKTQSVPRSVPTSFHPPIVVAPSPLDNEGLRAYQTNALNHSGFSSVPGLVVPSLSTSSSSSSSIASSSSSSSSSTSTLPPGTIPASNKGGLVGVGGSVGAGGGGSSVGAGGGGAGGGGGGDGDDDGVRAKRVRRARDLDEEMDFNKPRGIPINKYSQRTFKAHRLNYPGQPKEAHVYYNFKQFENNIHAILPLAVANPPAAGDLVSDFFSLTVNRASGPPLIIDMA